MGLFSSLFGSCSEPQPGSPGATQHPASRLRVGQVWAIKTPSEEPDVRLTILHVESRPQIGTIVHVALSGLALSNGQGTVEHMPFTEAAIESSVTSLIQESGPLPDFHEGYELWREANGGVFTIEVAEALDAIELAVKQHTPRNP
jgi:hypothetical protein